MRTDVHSPSRLVTEDYEYLFAADNQEPWVLRLGDWGREMSRWVNATDRLGRGTGQCHHCGARLRYFAVLRHRPTGDAVVVGEQCMGNRFSLATEDFHRLRKAAGLDKARQEAESTIADRLAAWLAANPEAAWLAEDELPSVIAQDDQFILDLREKLRRYGYLTERQVAAAQRALAAAIRRAAERAAEPPPVPAPSGRLEVRGEVLGTKVLDTDFGLSHKMLVRVPAEGGAWKLWCTIPRAMDVPERGDHVALRVTVKPSDSDPCFAIGSRPTVVKG